MVLMVVVTTLLAPLILNRMLRNEPLDDERAAEDRTVVSMGKILDSPAIGSAEQDASKRDATED